MKYVVLAALLFCHTVSHSQGITRPKKGKAVVYFVRTMSLAFAIDFTYYDSTKVIGRFNSRNYIRYECEPGEHLFWASASNQDFITAELEAGKIYFVEAVPSAGVPYAQVFLHPIDPNDKRMDKLDNIINKFTPRVMTESELLKETQTQEKIISKALEKYQEDLAKGKKKFKRLEKTMFYQY